MKQWIIDRLKEPSTWKGLSVVLGACGVGIAPTLIMEIGTGVAAVIGVVEVIRSEKQGD